MNLYVRLLIALARAGFGNRHDYRAALLSRFRVWPHDLDAFGHMNNGRYLQIMDVARVDWMARVGVTGCMWRRRWSAVIGSGIIRFRHALKPFECYSVRTRLLYWDSRWWYLEHVFIDRGGRQVAVGVSKAGIRSGREWVPTEAMVLELAPGANAPEAPPYLSRWIDIEDELLTHAASAAIDGSVQPAAIPPTRAADRW